MPQLPPTPKEAALRKNGCLHPHPDRVRDELFRENPFFDPRDLTQVKYEMLRRTRAEGDPVSASAARFGLSRVSFYKARRAWEEGGLPALLPQRPGPHGPHKLTAEVVAALRAARTETPALNAQELTGLVRERFGLSVHRRSIARAWRGWKKTAVIAPGPRVAVSGPPGPYAAAYERLRAQALAASGAGRGRPPWCCAASPGGPRRPVRRSSRPPPSPCSST